MANRLLTITRNNAAFVGVLRRVFPALAIVTRAQRPIVTRAGAFILKRS